MKNYLKTITDNPIVKKLCGAVGNYYVLHEGGILTFGTVVFNAAGIAITYKNSPAIHDELKAYHDMIELLKTNVALSDEEKKEYKKQMTAATVKDLTPLIAPIMIFFASSTACAVINKKKSDAKIASLSAALSLAQSTIKEYSEFRKEATELLGEEKVEQIDKTVTETLVKEDPPKETYITEHSDDDIPFFDPYSNTLFYSNWDRILLACSEMGKQLLACDEVDLTYYHDMISVPQTKLDQSIVWHAYIDGCNISPRKTLFDYEGRPCYKITLHPMPKGFE